MTMHCKFENQACVCCGSKSPKLAKGAKLLRKCKAPCDRQPDVLAGRSYYVPGPGTELKAILLSLGIEQKPNCGCRGLMNEMNALGVDGCRRERDRLIAALREKREAFGLADTAKAAALAFANGLAFQISWFDPMPDLFDMAVSRAEEKSIPVSIDENTAGIQPTQ